MRGSFPVAWALCPPHPLPRHIAIPQDSQALDSNRCVGSSPNFWGTGSLESRIPLWFHTPTPPPPHPSRPGSQIFEGGWPKCARSGVHAPLCKGVGYEAQRSGGRLRSLVKPPFHPASTSGGGSSPRSELTHAPHLTLISASEPSWEGQPPTSPSRRSSGWAALTASVSPRGPGLATGAAWESSGSWSSAPRN